MPLTDDEYDSGREDVELQVLWFLREHRGLAYTIEEITFELGEFGLVSTFEEVISAITSLQCQQRIESRRVLGAMYYRLVRRIGFRTS